MADAAISVEGVWFDYDERPVLRDVSCTIPAGKFTVMLGKNGSGKSTLLRILTGVMGCDRGSVRVMGQDIDGLSSSQRAHIIGFLPQHHRSVFPFAVKDVVLTGRASYVTFVPGREDEERALQALERVGMIHLKDRAFTELSGGEQQLVRVARVLAQDPSLIMLDEPTSHLDFVNQARLLGLVRELVDTDLTVLAVLHDPNSAFLYGDEFIFLKDGQIQPLAAGEKPWDRSVIARVYDTELHTVPYGERAIVIPKT